MSATTAMTLSPEELILLQHDLNGSLAVIDGFLSELDETVVELGALPTPIDAETLGGLLEDDFRPCLDCMATALNRLRTTVSRFDVAAKSG